MKYRTIVADPPWPIHEHGVRTTSRARWWANSIGKRYAVPYSTMQIAQIEALPVDTLADVDSHLYLWTINRFVRESYGVAEAWGFTPSILLTWCKEPMGLGYGGAYTNTTEFILFARRGSLKPIRRWDSSWFKFTRPTVDGHLEHSRKPYGLQDIVEQVSPGPYVELFAREHRLGWDVWGNESANTATLEPSA